MRDAPHDQPQRLVRPARRRVGGLGDPGVLEAVGGRPGVIGDALKRRPHRARARHRDREAHAVSATVGEQVDAIEAGVEARGDRAVADGQVAQRAPEHLARLLAAGGVVARQQLRGE
jgi:hypothetical protein